MIIFGKWVTQVHVVHAEIYFDLGDEFDGELPTVGDPKDRYIEIWNLVSHNTTKHLKVS